MSKDADRVIDSWFNHLPCIGKKVPTSGIVMNDADNVRGVSRIWTDGQTLYSYNMPIAKHGKEKIFIILISG
jgi:hypothetical protein